MIIIPRYIILTARSIHIIKKLILFISKDVEEITKRIILFICENLLTDIGGWISLKPQFRSSRSKICDLLLVPCQLKELSRPNPAGSLVICIYLQYGVWGCGR